MPDKLFEEITSFKNPRIKEVVLLREKKSRYQKELIIVEGLREITRALEAGVYFRELFFCEDFLDKDDERKIFKTLPTHTKIYKTTSDVFSKICFGERKEGLIAVCRRPESSLKDISLSRVPLIVVIEQIEKPGNLGAILRICDGAGVDLVLVCDRLTDIYNPNVIRASVGTVFSLKIAEALNGEALDFLKKNKIHILATLPQTKTVYSDAALNQALAIVLGSEEKGLSEFWKKNAEMSVKIPMHGQADSLNVSATAAIIIYEALRQRSQ